MKKTEVVGEYQISKDTELQGSTMPKYWSTVLKQQPLAI